MCSFEGFRRWTNDQELGLFKTTEKEKKETGGHDNVVGLSFFESFFWIN